MSLLVGVFLVLAPTLEAQQAEVPPAPPVDDAGDGASAAQPLESDRIVDGKPAFYSFERALHPVSWLEAGVRPLLRAVGKAGVDRFGSGNKSESVSGVKVGINALGSSSGFGPEIKPFNKNLFNSGIRVELPFIVTYRLYESARLNASFPLITDGDTQRLRFELTGGYQSRPSENLFGIGNDSTPATKSEFRSVTRFAGVGLTTRVGQHWSAGLEGMYRSVGITRPKALGSTPTSAIETFEDFEIPGLTTSSTSTLISTTAFVQRDTRDGTHFADSGGLERVEATLTQPFTGGDFAYWQYAAEFQRFLPLTKDHRSVIGLRARAETTQEKAGSAIPFFDLPTIGSYSTVRGFESRRFTDKSAMAATLEYRYRIWRYFDWHFFGDTGQVAPEIRNFAWDRLHYGYGTGIIFRTGSHRAIIMDVAHSREKTWMFYLDFNSLF